MPDDKPILTSAQAELERQMAQADDVDHGGCAQVTVDREKVEGTVAGELGDHWTIGAYGRYYWDRAKGWAAGAWAKVTWGGA